MRKKKIRKKTNFNVKSRCLNAKDLMLELQMMILKRKKFEKLMTHLIVVKRSIKQSITQVMKMNMKLNVNE